MLFMKCLLLTQGNNYSFHRGKRIARGKLQTTTWDRKDIYSYKHSHEKKVRWEGKLMWENMFLKLPKYIFKSPQDNGKNNVGERQNLKNTGLIWEASNISKSYWFVVLKKGSLVQHLFQCNTVQLNRTYPTAQGNSLRRLNFEIWQTQQSTDRLHASKYSTKSIFIWNKILSLNSSYPVPPSWWFYWSWHIHMAHVSNSKPE